MTAVQSLPHWDMSVVFPSLESPELDAEFRWVVDEIAELARLFEDYDVARHDALSVDQTTVERFDTVMQRLWSLEDRLTTLFAYISAFVSTDSRDDVAQARRSELQQHTVRLAQLGTRFTAWIGSMDVDALIESSEIARDHEFMLREAKIAAQHLMSQPEEDLATQLQLTGSSAWSRLHGNVTSQLLVPIELEGQPHELPMAVVRNLALNADRETRRVAYEAELAAWERVEVPLAAALNSIKGESNVVNEARGWTSALDVALFNNNIDRQTLDAMLEAARASFPDFRRYLRVKARALGLETLAWYDLFAPLGAASRTWEFDDAVGFLLDQFGDYSDRLRTFAERAFRERWIDAEPREGKVGGAFCMRLRGDESRILANYVSSYDGMSTLAHELGHAYHNFNLAGRTPFQRSTPMALAETASIFCQTIVGEAALARSDEAEQLSIVEASLQDACQVVVDITSRYLFETAVFERRRQRELSIEELNELMLATQRDTYGDGLDPALLHRYMWAVKGHYYSAYRPYYNFPYMFGLLFGLGLYARYQQDPNSFRASYDDLLSSTGLADAATLAARFGIDIRTPEFWSSSLDIVRANIDRFESLVGAGVAQGG